MIVLWPVALGPRNQFAYRFVHLKFFDRTHDQHFDLIGVQMFKCYSTCESMDPINCPHNATTTTKSVMLLIHYFVIPCLALHVE